MKKLLLIMLLVLFGCNQDITQPQDELFTMSMEQPTTNPGDLPWPMIVGGTEVDPACPDCKYPFMVSVQTNGGWHFCGGSLVREDWVVTAAHCVDGDSPGSIRVRIGLHDIDGTSGMETRYVDQIIVHPNYSGWSLDNDYALLHLSSPSSFEPIQLITDESHDDEPVMSTVMGWGAIYYGGPGSDVLLEVDVPIDDDCGNYSPGDITDNMVCAGDENGGEDSCQGDSGGPLIMTNSDGEYELIGIVSWGYGCADFGHPGVYSRIHTRLDWFFGYIGEPEPPIDVVLGDTNFDGELNVVDVVIMISFILNVSDPTEEEYMASDCNEDGTLNVLDVIVLINWILGLDFNSTVIWLEEHFPELEVERRLKELNMGDKTWLN